MQFFALGCYATVSMGLMLSASMESRLGRMLETTVSMTLSPNSLIVSLPFINISMALSLFQEVSGPMKVSKRRSKFSTRAPIWLNR